MQNKKMKNMRKLKTYRPNLTVPTKSFIRQGQTQEGEERVVVIIEENVPEF